ncbi:MAG TPA: sensor histidine kinase [Rhizomicrobium sp.]|nr:sensor histidine kinase [Rhizomicrobium sp.]
MAALETLFSESISYLPGSELVREANHRIANHLSMIVGMVQIQAAAVARGPDHLPRATVQDMLQDMAGKILSVSHLHRRLADAPLAGEIDIAAYLVESCGAVMSSLALRNKADIVYHLGEKCLVSPECAQTITLIVNEIVMNAVKHAHPSGLPTQICIGCGRNAKGRSFVEIYDDGVGLPEHFDEKKDGGVGFKLIRALARQVGAALAIESSSLGLLFRLTLAP